MDREPGDSEWADDLRYKDGLIHRFMALEGVTNAAGLAAIVDRNGNTVTITRQTLGAFRDRITRITEPAGRAFVIAYDGDGRISTVTDPIGRAVGYTYDAAGRLKTVTDPVGGVTRYDYDAEHRITAITDARGITYLTNEYDASGRVTRQTQADSGVWRFDYFAVGVLGKSSALTCATLKHHHRSRDRGRRHQPLDRRSFHIV